MQSAIVKRSIVIAGHKTSVSLEDEFWSSLKEIGKDQRLPLSSLVAGIDTQRLHANLSSAIRLFVLDYFRKRLTPEPPTVRDASGMELPQVPNERQQSQRMNGHAGEQQ
jgi:predicted DNA-binding ribbon-helix-helix protein